MGGGGVVKKLNHLSPRLGSSSQRGGFVKSDKYGCELRSRRVILGLAGAPAHTWTWRGPPPILRSPAVFRVFSELLCILQPARGQARGLAASPPYLAPPGARPRSGGTFYDPSSLRHRFKVASSANSVRRCANARPASATLARRWRDAGWNSHLVTMPQRVAETFLWRTFFTGGPPPF